MKSVGLPDRCLDIIVFCLSLMNKNWPDHIAEDSEDVWLPMVRY